MKKLDVYMAREVLLPFILSLVVFPCIMLVDSAFAFQDLFLTKQPPFSVFMKMILLRAPAFLVLAFPIAVLIGTFMALSRMGRDQEILALRMAGVSFYRIMLPFLLLSIVFSLLSFVTNEVVVPQTNHASENIKRRLILTRSVPAVQENILFQGGENQHFYVRRYRPATRTLLGVAVYELLDPAKKFPRVITAQKARLYSDVWELQDGVAHQYGPDGFQEYEVKFSRLKIPVSFSLVEFLAEQRTPQEMKGEQLRKQIEAFKKGGVDTRRLETDYYFKFSIPFACVIITILGAPLSFLFARSGSFVGLAICIVLILLYYSLMVPSRNFGFSGVLPPVLAAWLPNFFFLSVGVVLVYKIEH